MAMAAPAASPSPTGESITNVQEAGVDEGGIVKPFRDFLVVLRRGRLLSVRVGEDGLEPVHMVDAYPPGTRGSGWYDEMLIRDDTIVYKNHYDIGVAVGGGKGPEAAQKAGGGFFGLGGLHL